MIIATKGRPSDLERTLASIGRCDPLPEELIVVDGDEGRSAQPVTERFGRLELVPETRYVASPPGLTRQRNLGVAEARGEIVVFLDDDVELQPDLFAELRRGYLDGAVIGATGVVVESDGRGVGGKRAPVRRLLLGGPDGSMTAFGYPRRLLDEDAERDVEFMQGCLMTARRDAAARVGFDESLPGYGLAEDEDFSYRLSREGRIRFLPRVRVIHHNTGFRTADQRSFNRTVVVNRAYLLRKNFKPTLATWVHFALFLLVLAVHRALNREWRGVAGLLDGVRDARRAIH